MLGNRLIRETGGTTFQDPDFRTDLVNIIRCGTMVDLIDRTIDPGTFLGRSGWMIRPSRVTTPRRSPSNPLYRSMTSQPRCSAMVSSIVGPTARPGRLPPGAPAVDSSATRAPWQAGWPLGIWLAGGTVRQDGDIGPIATAAAIALLVTFVTYHWFGAKARAMLGAFTDYLRASLGGLRRGEVTLGEELALAEAYLHVQATRMEERLRFSIEADEATRRAPLLPLLLQPLVENAVQHGLEPQIEGGSVSVFARTEGDEVVVEVRDDGRGPDAPAETPQRRGAGLALANVRERLVAAFGSDASLTLAPARPGTLATLRLPRRASLEGAR